MSYKHDHVVQAPSLPPKTMATPVSAPIQEPDNLQEKRHSLTSDDSDEAKKSPGSEAPPQRPGLGERKDSEYPPPAQVAIVMLALMLALFLMALDRTIIATAIPRMTDDFHSIDDIGWYGSAFMLTACSFQLLLGRVYTFCTPKYVFLVIIFIFEAGSALCGAAPNSVAFIIGRAIAGVGSAGITSGAVVLMVQTIPLRKRPIYMGLFGAVFGLASVVGPLLGGVFTSDVSWRWCFYINLPIGGVAMLIIAFILKPTPAALKDLSLRQKVLKLDLLGELFLLPCIICLLLALQWGGATYAWSDGRIIALFVVFGVLLVAFVLVQIFMQETATIPASAIGNRSVIAAMFFVFCLSSSMMLLVYFIPIWFQAIKGVSAVRSGIDTIPMVLSLVVGAISSGQIIGRIGYYTPFMLASAIVMPIGSGLVTTWTSETSSPSWIGHQILFGFGLGMGMQQGALAAQTVLNKVDVPTGVSLMFFQQMLGGALFVSVGQNLFDSSLISGVVKLVPGLSPIDVVNAGATNLKTVIPPQHLPEVLIAYNSALRQAFVAATAMAALSILGAVAVEWRSVKGKQGPKAKAGEEVGPDESKAPEVKV